MIYCFQTLIVAVIYNKQVMEEKIIVFSFHFFSIRLNVGLTQSPNETLFGGSNQTSSRVPDEKSDYIWFCWILFSCFQLWKLTQMDIEVDLESLDHHVFLNGTLELSEFKLCASNARTSSIISNQNFSGDGKKLLKLTATKKSMKGHSGAFQSPKHHN